MQAPLLPRQVELKRLGSGRHAYEGQVPVEALAELEGAGERPGPVQASIMLDLSGSMPRVTGRCEGSIQLQCQRCLEPVDVALESEFELVVVDRASDADGLDEGQTWVEAPRGILDLARLAEEEMLLALPVIVLTGLAFASIAMVVTALAPSYDFFMFYQTLVLTPMLLLSGVFFPASQLPAAARVVTEVLPLAHAVDLIRPAMLGRPVEGVVLHVAVLAAYAVGGFVVSAVLFRRRMMK